MFIIILSSVIEQIQGTHLRCSFTHVQCSVVQIIFNVVSISDTQKMIWKIVRLRYKCHDLRSIRNRNRNYDCPEILLILLIFNIQPQNIRKMYEWHWKIYTVKYMIKRYLLFSRTHWIIMKILSKMIWEKVCGLAFFLGVCASIAVKLKTR